MDLPDGKMKLGSGYRVTADVVLTASHVVEGARKVQARFTADLDHKVPAEMLWTVGEVTALRVPPEKGLSPVRYGLVERHATEIPCEAVGFPLWKWREDVRDSAQVKGSILPLSNRYTNTLHVGVDRPPAENPESSPWKGMSGAALFVRDRLVGIIQENHHPEGAAHLTAKPVDWERLTPEQRAQIGYAGEPPSVNPLPGRNGHGYQAGAEELRPAGGLRDRDRELAELAEFCAGDEPYLWLQGPAWAGKSALVSSFVLNPPDGVRVAAFFVHHSRADAGAFLQDMGGQLADIAGIPGGAPRPDGVLTDVLTKAAERCLAGGKRLLLVVDGLDEDTNPYSSIASLLPLHPPEGVRVLVTGRPHPGIPTDVRDDHPLRRCRVWSLQPSAHAAVMQSKAGLQFETSSQEPGDKRLLGAVAAAQGALTLDDLAKLTKLERNEVRGRLWNPIFTRTADGYVYAHETLHRRAEEELVEQVELHRGRIHEWADSYREQGWPPGTPAYLLRSYGRLLTDRARLLDYALDRARHERMRELVGGESAALGELTAAQQRLGGEADPDLVTLARLAVAREQLSKATAPPPVELPALWARLGDHERAERLADSIVDADARPAALSAVARAMAEAGDLRRAESVACSIDDMEQRGSAMGAVVQAMADRREASAAERLARSIEETAQRVRALAAVAEASRSADLLDETEQLVRSVVDLDDQARAMTAVVKAAAVCGDVARAEALVDRIPLMRQRVWALSHIMRALAGGDRDRIPAVTERAVATVETIAGELGHDRALGALVTAVAYCGDVERAADLAVKPGRNSYACAHALTALAATVSAAGNLDLAVELAEAVPIPAMRTNALCIVAREIAKQGDRPWALDLAGQAKALACHVKDKRRRARAMVAVAGVLGACADPEADTVIDSIESPYQRVQALVAVAGTVPDRDLARALAMRAEELARPQARVWPPQVLVPVARAVAAAGDLDRAEALACVIRDRDVQTSVLSDLVRLIAGQDPARAESVVLGRIRGAQNQARAMVWVAKGLAAHGELDRAEKLALSLPDLEPRARALAMVVEVEKIPDTDRALNLARKIPHADRRDKVHTDLIRLMAARGSLPRAEKLARKLPADHRVNALLAVAAASDPAPRRTLLEEAGKLVEQVRDEGRKARLVTALAKALVGAGRLREAKRLARGIPFPDLSADALADVAVACASLGHVGDALTLVRKIEATAVRARAYVAVVTALVDRREVPAALRIAVKEIPTADHMAQALAVLVRAAPGGKDTVAEAARRAESLLVPQRITHPDSQLRAFVDLLRAIVDSAGPSAARDLADRIEKLAAEIEDADRQAQILVALSRIVEPARGRRLLARVLSGPAWTAALDTLHATEPRALPLIADELLAGGGNRARPPGEAGGRPAQAAGQTSSPHSVGKRELSWEG
ncbi:hypothetical protein Ssi03_40590 [Sphaerisporangium siamense]|uniref:Uncharacterized protein n=1 Tax=Sphaerisporangium siamense TaxID=795645 RepID=A0A7W7DCS2_9ACTN|nr:serine protease [Sphaerisporangium siamense]MBB4704460.1 hypothetical protein [Sphaerisporangium siamense]GII86069.1 hypothetical protein Ssi03_40590 [Sphaerisporangium siamense]